MVHVFGKIMLKFARKNKIKVKSKNVWRIHTFLDFYFEINKWGQQKIIERFVLFHSL